MFWLGREFRVALLAAGVLGIGPVQAQTPPAEPPPPASPETPAPTWILKGGAVLQTLDKVNARHAVLDVKAGGQAQYGSLRIAVQACVVRPANEPQDAAAFLTITDVNLPDVNFRGWMFANEPALSMLQHPMFDIRVTGCLP